jgi:hypothetical protein
LAWSAEESPPAVAVPDNYVMVVRCIDVVSNGGAIINWQVEIVEGGKFAVGQFTIEALAQLNSWRGHQILNAGEHLAFSSDGSTDGAISGYLLFTP